MEANENEKGDKLTIGRPLRIHNGIIAILLPSIEAGG